jgi:hypothetical protein
MRNTWLIAVAAFCATVGVGLAITRHSGPASADAPQAAQTDLAQTAQTNKPAASSAGQTISIPTLGLSVVRPAGWSTVTAEQNSRNLRSVQMDDRKLQELAARYATVPVVALAKYPEPYDDLNPSFKINVRPIGGFAGHAPEDILLAATPTLQRMFGEVRFEEAPRRTTIDGRSAAYARLSYTLRAGGKAFPTISEIWVVPSGPVFFMIGTGTRADERNGTRAEARAIVDSIRLH